MPVPNLPALTLAEKDVVDRYLRVVDLVGRINPSQTSPHQSTRGRELAAQALVSEARSLLAAIRTMRERGQEELHVATITNALLALDGERRAARVMVRHDTSAEPDR